MDENLKRAIAFCRSERGNYIISQALYVAIEAMGKVPIRKREESNIMDMQYLLETLFPIYKNIQEARSLAIDPIKED